MNKKSKVLGPTELNSNGGDFHRTYHHLVVDPSVTVDDVMVPKFWAHHVANLKINDLIDIVAADDSWDVQLRVVEKGIGYVKMRPRMVWMREETKARTPDQPANEPDMPEGYKVTFSPNKQVLWQVTTIDPHAVVSKGHKSRVEAINAAIAHARKALAA